jgi:hypothetical protein
MRARLFLWLITASLLHVRLATAQEVEGRVYLPKASAAAQAITGRYQLDSGNASEAESPAAVVYLQPASGRGEKLEGHKTVEMTQKNIRFVPGLLAIQSRRRLPQRLFLFQSEAVRSRPLPQGRKASHGLVR